MTNPARAHEASNPFPMAVPAGTARSIVIVGAGFSGALTAVNLLRLAPPGGLRVVLVNKSGRMARGIAYGTRSAEHVLNVPIYDLAFIWGVGPRVEVSGANAIPGFPYSAPFEDLKLKP